MKDPQPGRWLKRAVSVWPIVAAIWALTLFSSKLAKAGPTTTSAMRFEPNQGQFDAQTRFLARGRSYALFLTPDGATLTLHDQRAVLTMKLRGALPVEPRALEPLQALATTLQAVIPRVGVRGLQPTRVFAMHRFFRASISNTMAARRAS